MAKRAPNFFTGPKRIRKKSFFLDWTSKSERKRKEGERERKRKKEKERRREREGKRRKRHWGTVIYRFENLRSRKKILQEKKYRRKEKKKKRNRKREEKEREERKRERERRKNERNDRVRKKNATFFPRFCVGVRKWLKNIFPSFFSSAYNFLRHFK